MQANRVMGSVCAIGAVLLVGGGLYWQLRTPESATEVRGPSETTSRAPADAAELADRAALSPQNESCTTLLDRDAPAASRIASIEALGPALGSSAAAALLTVARAPDDPTDLRMAALERLEEIEDPPAALGEALLAIWDQEASATALRTRALTSIARAYETATNRDALLAELVEVAHAERQSESIYATTAAETLDALKAERPAVAEQITFLRKRLIVDDAAAESAPDA